MTEVMRLQVEQLIYLARREALLQAVEVAHWYENAACSNDCNLLADSIYALIDGDLGLAKMTQSGER